MVITASVIAHERVPTTTVTESRNMAAITQIIAWQRHAALVCCVLLWYWTSMLWSIDTCQNKVSADPYHVTISQAQVYSLSRSHVFVFFFFMKTLLYFILISFFHICYLSMFFWSSPLIKCWFFIASRAHVWLTCWKQGRIVQKGVNTNPGFRIKTEL